jgi:putative oxidoreductase
MFSGRAIVLNMFLAAIFLGFGFSALIGVDTVRQEFFAWGYPDWFRWTIGFVEVVAAGCLLIAPAAAPAAAVLIIVMLGQIGAHLRAGEGPFALIPLVLALCLAYVGWRSWRRQKAKA